MLWIKRNLIFVITAVVGLLLAGWAGYSLTNSMSEDKAVKDDFDSVMNELNGLRNMNPYPTPENIDAAKAEATQMRGLLGQFQTVFAPFPAVPTMNEQTFAAELAHRIGEWQSAAKAASVKIPEAYAFSFSGLTGQLAFPSNCIPGWLEQFNEIQGICDVLNRAHVNELDSIQRVPVYPGDQGGTDFLQTSWVTNELGVMAPYQLSFVCFTRELSQVLEGLMSATNCYVVKSVVVAATKAQPGSGGGPVAPQIPQRYAPAPVTSRAPVGDRYGGALGGGAAPTPAPAAPVYVYRAAAPTGPVTVIRERPLFVTLVVDAIQIKPVAAAR